MEELSSIFSKLNDIIEIKPDEVYNYIEKYLQNNCCKSQDPEHWYRYLEEIKKCDKTEEHILGRDPDNLLRNKIIPWEIKYEKHLLEELAKNKQFYWINYLNPLDLTSMIQVSQMEIAKHGIPIKLLAERGLTKNCSYPERLEKYKANPEVQKAKQIGLSNLLEGVYFTPDLENLYVYGKGYEQKKNVEEEVKGDVIDTEEKIKECIIKSQSDTETILEIDGRLINYNSSIDDCTQDITLFYDNGTGENSATITISNKGTTVIHYKWIKVPSKNNLSLPVKFSAPDQTTFYFDCLNGSLLPGDHIKLCFLFKPQFSGKFKEIWQMITQPIVTTNQIKLVLNGFSYKEFDVTKPDIYYYIQNETNKISKKPRKKVIKFTSPSPSIEDLLKKSKVTRPMGSFNLTKAYKVFTAIHTDSEENRELQKLLELAKNIIDSIIVTKIEENLKTDDVLSMWTKFFFTLLSCMKKMNIKSKFFEISSILKAVTDHYEELKDKASQKKRERLIKETEQLTTQDSEERKNKIFYKEMREKKLRNMEAKNNKSIPGKLFTMF